MNHTRIREILLLFLALNNNSISKGVQHLAGHRRQSRAVKTLNIKSLYAKEFSRHKERNGNTGAGRNNRIRTFLGRIRNAKNRLRIAFLIFRVVG